MNDSVPLQSTDLHEVGERIYVGSRLAAQYQCNSDKYKFTHIISLAKWHENGGAEARDAFVKRNGKYLSLDNIQDTASEDWAGLVKRKDLVQFIDEFKKAEFEAEANKTELPVLMIFCRAGMKRSVFLGTYLIITLRGYKTTDAMRKVALLRNNMSQAILASFFDTNIRVLEEVGGPLDKAVKEKELFERENSPGEWHFKPVTSDQAQTEDRRKRVPGLFCCLGRER